MVRAPGLAGVRLSLFCHANTSTRWEPEEVRNTHEKVRNKPEKVCSKPEKAHKPEKVRNKLEKVRQPQPEGCTHGPRAVYVSGVFGASGCHKKMSQYFLLKLGRHK